MSSESDTAATDTESIATITLSTAFCAEDADLIIRVEGALDFRVHKCLLSLVSPILKDIFANHQLPTDTSDDLPHIPVRDPPEAWENILRTIYPMQNPTIHDLDDLESLFLTAKQYEMDFVIRSHTQCFENMDLIRKDPLRLYAIACVGGLEKQAKYVASRAELSTVVARATVSDLKCLTWDSYHKLVSFLVRRDQKWGQMLAAAQVPNEFNCKCLSREEYDMIRKDLESPHLSTDEVYLNAVKRSSQECSTLCANPQIKGFVDSTAKRKDAVVNKLRW